MKDRIKLIMESQHMTQQAFSKFTGISAAVLSGIFTGRTKPTINQVEAIRKKIPNISLAWLLFGEGSMYDTERQDVLEIQHESPAPTLSEGNGETHEGKTKKNNGQGLTDKENTISEQKKLDILKRRITEIRVFYDDNTYEAFVPKTT